MIATIPAKTTRAITAKAFTPKPQKMNDAHNAMQNTNKYAKLIMLRRARFVRLVR
ncbi:MAG: hypothetical protein FWH51_05185 [Dehalococcoidia bacterium]|nr:hypothetical protein [Dehalococcoidia bacterium]